MSGTATTPLVTNRLIDAVKTARDTLELARVSFATTTANANINRREGRRRKDLAGIEPGRPC
jgi:hypothetical protein